ncbi:SDR family NAD(P)-dependent oxidoreductase [Actinomadura sp. 21ATH]|uniref:SDR family NAD(P)-dependent oxidoreductase n=1 Tax=Actinomadura sp. 21ATH TaxID=1735444 RepID=UPI0035C24EE5
MMDLVVAGGTTGMGRALADHYLARGARVTVIGSNASRGETFLRDAATDRAAFVQADLTSVAENRRAMKEIRARHDSLDVLALTALRHFPKRVVTPDGFEGVLSLYYVSRFLLSHGLTDLLEKGTAPIIVNICGVGTTKGEIRWNDLSLTNGYGPIKAMLQGGRAADLQGVAYPLAHPNGRTRYLLHHPGFTDSGTDSLTQPAKTAIKLLARLFAQSPEKAVAPIIDLIDNQPEGRLLAYDRRTPVDPSLRTLDRAHALRLYRKTSHLL